MEETKAEQNLAMAYLFPRGSDEKEVSRLKLLDLHVRMKHGDYVFKNDPTKSVARYVFEEEEKAKDKVRAVKNTVMSELRAIPGGPDASAAIGRLTGSPPGGRRTAIRKRKAWKARKTMKSRR
jgi:hypothetical protein